MSEIQLFEVVKSETLKVLLGKIPKDIELASIHTMFGPTEESLKGKNVIFTETGRAQKLALELERLFYKYGAIITHVSVEEHDKRVAYTQAIVHFISLGFGSFLNAEQVQLDPRGNARLREALHRAERVWQCEA